MNDWILLFGAFLLLVALCLFVQQKINEEIYRDFCEWFEEYQKTDEWKYEYEEKKAEES